MGPRGMTTQKKSWQTKTGWKMGSSRKRFCEGRCTRGRWYGKVKCVVFLCGGTKPPYKRLYSEAYMEQAKSERNGFRLYMSFKWLPELDGKNRRVWKLSVFPSASSLSNFFFADGEKRKSLSCTSVLEEAVE
eukprot:scaffold1426_cov83-Cylindrotheca_fusiformis.AAC.9